jgi:hypothetical protein
VKICLFRLIRVPILFCFLLSSNKLFPQIKVSLINSKYDLWFQSENFDTAFVKVATPKGHAVKSLSAEDFLITQKNDTAEILSCTPLVSTRTEDLAITFILDNSGSMFHAYDSLTKYLDGFIDSLGEGFTSNVMTFDNAERMRTYDGTSREQLFIASSEFTSDRYIIKNFWHSYDSIRTDLTPLYETILKGLERISDRRRSGDSLRREIIIVVTDGADNASPINIEKLSELATVMPITLFTINFNSDPDGRLLWLATKTKGDHYIVGNLWHLHKMLDDLRKDISYSYKLVYQFPFRGASSPH